MYQQQQQQQPFHAANYRGNQQGHDQYLRADSQQPTNYTGATNQVISQYRGAGRGFQPTGMVQSFYGQQGTQNQYGQGQATSQFNNPSFNNTNAFHASNYRGDQPGHDQYLRADSQQPSNIAGGFNSNMNAQSTGQYNQSFNNTNAFHASNYRGDQQGHDQYLRADSQQPSNLVGGFQNQMNQNQFTNQLQNNQYQNQFQNTTQPTQGQFGQSFSTYRG
jgi:hypothetical protein